MNRLLCVIIIELSDNDLAHVSGDEQKQKTSIISDEPLF